MLASNNKNVNRILLTGGGSGGSVSPLLAVGDKLKNDFEFLWIGTNFGPEKLMVEKENIEFKSISSGKLRRYLALDNFFDIFKVSFAFFQSLLIILKWKPRLVIAAGSFVSVPVIWAARVLGVKIIVHQQDVRPGLANKLMAPFADAVTVTFEKSLADYGKKAVLTGNPVRKLIVKNKNESEIRRAWNLREDLPVIFIMGGGTGAAAINNLVKEGLDELIEICQIIHVTGISKNNNGNHELEKRHYHCFEFLNSDEMAEAYAVSDCVISRTGMGALTEISSLGKPAILIPMPDSHQEDNAQVFKDKNAAIVLSQKELTKEKLIKNIKNILSDGALRANLRNNSRNVMIREADEKIFEVMKKLLNL